jgi:hypothetical protein
MRDHGTTRLIDSLQGASLYQAYLRGMSRGRCEGKRPMTKSLKSAPPDLTRISARNGGVFPLVRVRSDRRQLFFPVNDNYFSC